MVTLPVIEARMKTVKNTAAVTLDPVSQYHSKVVASLDSGVRLLVGVAAELVVALTKMDKEEFVVVDRFVKMPLRVRLADVIISLKSVVLLSVDVELYISVSNS